MSLERSFRRCHHIAHTLVFGLMALVAGLASQPHGIAADAPKPETSVAVSERKPPVPLSSLPAPKAGSPLRILLVDDDWSENNSGRDARLSAADEAFRTLVATAVGGDKNAWAVDVVELYQRGPSFERLREFNVIIWYTGDSYGGNPDNSAVLSLEDEKTVRRYLEEKGGSFILISPGYLSNLSYGTSWLASSHPFLTDVVGINGFAALTKRFLSGTVQAYENSRYTVEQRSSSPAEFSTVNPDGSAIVFSSQVDPAAKEGSLVPVAVAHPYGGGRCVYVGFTFENIPQPELARAFTQLLGASGALPQAATTAARIGPVRQAPATTLSAPTSPSAAALASAGVTDAPQSFAVTGAGRDSFNFYASQTGPIHVRVQSRGVPLIVTVFHPDGSKVDHTGAAAFTFDEAVSSTDLAKGHVWGIGTRAATTTPDTTIVASGSIIVSHPPVDSAAVQAQLGTLSSHTQVLKTATPVQTVSLTADNRSVLKASLIGTVSAPLEPASLPALLPVNPAFTIVQTAPPPPPSEPEPLTKYNLMAGGPGTHLVVYGKDLFPPGTNAQVVMANPAGFPAELHFIPPYGDEVVVTMTAVETSKDGTVGNDTETDMRRDPVDSYFLSWKYQRYYKADMPHLSVQQDTLLKMYLKTKDGRFSARVDFTYKPPMRDEWMRIPVANGQLYDSTVSSVYPNITLSNNNVRRDSYLLGFTGYDTFYNSYQLRNGWKVMDVVVKLVYAVGGSAEIAESRVGTPSPFVKVRWQLDPTFLMSSDLSYNITIHVRGPTEFEPFW